MKMGGTCASFKEEKKMGGLLPTWGDYLSSFSLRKWYFSQRYCTASELALRFAGIVCMCAGLQPCTGTAVYVQAAQQSERGLSFWKIAVELQRLAPPCGVNLDARGKDRDRPACSKSSAARAHSRVSAVCGPGWAGGARALFRKNDRRTTYKSAMDARQFARERAHASDRAFEGGFLLARNRTHAGGVARKGSGICAASLLTRFHPNPCPTLLFKPPHLLTNRFFFSYCRATTVHSRRKKKQTSMIHYPYHTPSKQLQYRSPPNNCK